MGMSFYYSTSEFERGEARQNKADSGSAGKKGSI